MNSWIDRPVEIANLFNPAFCGAVIYHCIAAYGESSKKSMPYPLLFLILPIVLPEKTRSYITPYIKYFHPWLDKHQDLKVDFSRRATDLNLITREAIIFLLQAKAIKLEQNACISITSSEFKIKKVQKGDEVEDCYKKAKILGRLFAKSGSVSTIYAVWGVRP